MKEFIVQRYHLEIAAAFLTNISAGWFLAILATKTVDGLIADLTYSILSLITAFQFQKTVQEYD